MRSSKVKEFGLSMADVFNSSLLLSIELRKVLRWVWKLEIDGFWQPTVPAGFGPRKDLVRCS